MEKQIPEFIKNIDWSELRNQKSSLMAVRDMYKRNKVPFIAEHLDGVLELISDVQRYAVEDAELIDPIHVYDFEAEEQRNDESPEQFFARNNAQIIFEIAIEGSMIYEDDEMSRKYIEQMVDDKFHADIIKSKMRQAIFKDVTNFPKGVKRDANGDYTYDSEMMDYAGVITEYCRELFVEKL